MISHHHKAIFIHIPKTAGQSIERVFLQLIGLSWKQRAPLLLRTNDEPSLGPPRLAHLRAYEYVKYCYLPQDLFDEYFIFTFVRNPWDRVISFYRYLGHSRSHTLHDYVKEILWRELKEEWYFVAPQTKYIYEGNHCIPNFVGRFENLQSDFNEICKRLAIQQNILPMSNTSPKQSCSKNKNDASYRKSCWTKQAHDIVAELYEEDITNFGYKFESTHDLQ